VKTTLSYIFMFLSMRNYFSLKLCSTNAFYNHIIIYMQRRNLRHAIRHRLPAPALPPLFSLLQGTGFRPGQRDRHPPFPVSWGHNKPETKVVVAVVRFVPVAVRRTRIPGIVVPATTAVDTFGT